MNTSQSTTQNNTQALPPPPSLITKVNKYLDSNGALAVLLIAYSLCAWIVGLHHEPWADEAQAWLIARDETLWNIIFAVPHYEGTPTLWHVILHFLQIIGLPYKYFFAVPILFNIGAIAILFKKSPFHPLIKWTLPFTYFVFYQYGIIARNYSLLFFFLALTATLFPQRLTRPLPYILALLGLTGISSHTYVISIALFSCCIYEFFHIKHCKWSDRSTAIIYIAIPWYLFLAYTCRPATDGTFSHLTELYRDVGIITVIFRTINYTANAFITNVDTDISGLQLLFCVALAFIVYSQYRQRPKYELIYPILLYTAPMAVFCFVWMGCYHLGILFLTSVFLTWIHPLHISDKPLSHKVITIIAIVAIIACQLRWTYKSTQYDVQHPYCTAQEVAIFLQQCLENYPNMKIQAYGFKTAAVSAYFAKCPFSYSAYKQGYWDWSAEPSRQVIIDKDTKLLLFSDYYMEPELSQTQNLPEKRFPAYIYFKDKVTDANGYILKAVR